MSMLIKRKKITLLLIMFSFLFINTQSFAASIKTRIPTKSDLKKFSEIFDSKTPLYEVSLLKRSCSKSVKGNSLGRNGKVYSCSYSPMKNLLLSDVNLLGYTIDSKNKEISNYRIHECQPPEYPGDRMDRVILRDDIIIGWFFENVASYCQIPVYTFPKKGGCYFSHCRLTVPAKVEVIFYSPYKEVAEFIRKSMKSISAIDSQDPYNKRSCMDLD